jgi:hypothetical protein
MSWRRTCKTRQQVQIRSAFTAYSRDDDPDWRSATWIKPEERSHLAMSILKELAARGFEIVKKT